MIKAILYDLDGTILDRESSLNNFIDDQYDKFINYLKHIEMITFKNKFIELDKNGYVWKDKVYAQLIDYFNINHLTPDLMFFLMTIQLTSGKIVYLIPIYIKF